ncbi:unnamed protein product [Ectocarpus sp. 4 AP-2014]
MGAPAYIHTYSSNPPSAMPPRTILCHGSLPLGAMLLLMVFFAGSLTVASAATTGSISAQTTSGNASLRSGNACDPEDADCLGDERDDSNFLGFAFICCIFLLLVMFRTLRVAAIWVRGTAMLVRIWARERGLMVRPGRQFQGLVI